MCAIMFTTLSLGLEKGLVYSRCSELAKEQENKKPFALCLSCLEYEIPETRGWLCGAYLWVPNVSTVSSSAEPSRQVLQRCWVCPDWISRGLVHWVRGPWESFTPSLGLPSACSSAAPEMLDSTEWKKHPLYHLRELSHFSKSSWLNNFMYLHLGVQ